MPGGSKLQGLWQACQLQLPAVPRSGRRLAQPTRELIRLGVSVCRFCKRTILPVITSLALTKALSAQVVVSVLPAVDSMDCTGVPDFDGAGSIMGSSQALCASPPSTAADLARM